MKTLKEYIKESGDCVRWKVTKDFSIFIERDIVVKNEDCSSTYEMATILTELFYKDDFLTWIDSDWTLHIKETDTKKEVIEKVRKYLVGKYVCVDDIQGRSFKVGDSMTLKEWKNWALQDRENSCDSTTYNHIKRTPLKSIISFIESLWELEIVKVEDQGETAMRKIETKMGIIFLGKNKDKKGGWIVFDSLERPLWYCRDKKEAKDFIATLQKYDSVKSWLETEEYGDVCWGSFGDIVDFTKDYQECNARKYDHSWLLENYNKVGKTFLMFEYSEAWR